MHTIQIAVTVCVLLAIGLLVRPLSRITRLPYGALLVIAGYVASETVIAFGYDTGLRWQLFRDLVLYLLLPALVFNAAVQTDVNNLKRFGGLILALALPLLLVSTVLCAVALYFAIGHPSGFPWLAAMIAASIFVATDPVAVSAVLSRHRAPHRVAALVEGEGTFADALAIAMFGSLIAFALAMDSGAAHYSGIAVLKFLWGVVAGIACGYATSWLLQKFVWHKVTGSLRGLLSIAYVYGLYLSVELLAQASGVIALLVAGVILGKDYKLAMSDEESDFVAVLWRLFGLIAYMLLFLLVGATITLEMFKERWLAMLLAIAAVSLARLPGIFVWLPLQTRMSRGSESLDWRDLLVIYFGGARGAVTLALALSLPVELPYWWTIQSMAYGVVMFSLFVQVPVVGLLASRYQSDDSPQEIAPAP